MAVTERRRPDGPGAERAARPAPPTGIKPEWSWDRSFPTAPYERARPAHRVRMFPGLTWWTAGMITVMFVVLVLLS